MGEHGSQIDQALNSLESLASALKRSPQSGHLPGLTGDGLQVTLGWSGPNDFFYFDGDKPVHIDQATADELRYNWLGEKSRELKVDDHWGDRPF